MVLCKNIPTPIEVGILVASRILYYWAISSQIVGLCKYLHMLGTLYLIYTEILSLTV